MSDKTDWVAWVRADAQHHLPWIINCKDAKGGVDVWHTGGPGGSVATFHTVADAEDCCNMSKAVIDMADTIVSLQEELKCYRDEGDEIDECWERELLKVRAERNAMHSALKELLPFIKDMRNWVPAMAEEAGWDDEEDGHGDMMENIERHVKALKEALGES